jgi:hypothetical protein
VVQLVVQVVQGTLRGDFCTTRADAHIFVNRSSGRGPQIAGSRGGHVRLA